MTTNTAGTLAQIAIDRPHAPGIFMRHGLDFCCHGRRSLEEACAEQGLDPQAVLAEIDEAAPPAADEPSSWKDRPVAELVDHILARYHAPLRGDVATLITLAGKVERVHAAKPTCPRGLAEHLAQVAEALESHLGKEEQILFPMIKSGHGAMARMPVNVMMQEHDDHGESLRRTRQLTGDLVIPPEACNSWRALYLGLERLERELMEHIHLENNILFPRVLNGDGDLEPQP